jgi:transcriptional regulator with GAF, ATPase, and Fis domain
MAPTPLDAGYEPEFESLHERLLELAQIRSVDELLRRLVTLLAERPHVALARIWLKQPGDRCEACARRQDCPGQTTCLQLVASAGRPHFDRRSDWGRLDGEFSRIPVGVDKIGRIAATGESVVVKDLVEEPDILTYPEWIISEGIHGFNGQPILFKGEVLGVLALFTRIRTPRQSPAWVRIFANQIAVTLVNARAFEEIEHLRAGLELENRFLREEINESVGGIIGRSAGIRQLMRQLDMVGPTEATVLILGESGSGKELVAHEIHRRSRRSQRPLIRVNCASVPRELYESEFFGHAKGAFTGAVKDRAGRFEAADGGTLFLDEVGEIPLELQSKFLRVLQERQYERVGEEKTRNINVRIIAATNCDLEAEVAAGRFRQDLFYRLNVFPVRVLPLRERREDVPLLIQHFLEQSARRLNLPVPPLTPAQLEPLQAYDWPGNVRELQNVVERAAILAQRGEWQFDLPARRGQASVVPTSDAAPASGSIVTETEMRRRERENLRMVLERAGGKVHGPGGAAELLGVKPTTLISRLKKFGLK